MRHCTRASFVGGDGSGVVLVPSVTRPRRVAGRFAPPPGAVVGKIHGMSRAVARRGQGRSTAEHAAIGPLAGSSEGPLVPVDGGWRLRRIEGLKVWNHLPQSVRRSVVAVLLPVPTMGLLGAVTVSVVTGHPALAWLFLPMMYGVLLGPYLARRRMSGLFDAHAPTGTLAGRGRGEPVKVRGRVCAGPTFESWGLRRRCVLACYVGTVEYVTGRLSDGRESPWSESRGIDFALELEDGQRLQVRARDAYLANRPSDLDRLFFGRDGQMLAAPVRRFVRGVPHGTVAESIFAETTIAPGDLVEVLGTLDFEVSAAGEGGPGRGQRLLPVLGAGGKAPLVVRLIRGARAGEDPGDAG